MPRPEKVEAVAEIKERIEGAQAVFLAEYAGLSVQEQQALRRGLRSSEAEFKVVKMSLARRAASSLGLDDLDELLSGPTALTFADGDPVSAAKALKDFSADHAALLIKGGLMGTDFLPPEKVSQLADIEPREVLLAKLAGAIQAPMANMAGLLSALLRNSASAFKQLLDKKEAEAPAEPAAPPVAAAAEEPEAEATAEAEVAATEEAAAEAEAAAEEAAPEADAEEAAPEAEAAAEEAAPEAAAEEAAPEPEAVAEEPEAEAATEEPEATTEEEDVTEAAEAAAETADADEPAEEDDTKPADPAPAESDTTEEDA